MLNLRKRLSTSAVRRAQTAVAAAPEPVEKPFVNPVGIQYLSGDLQRKLFPQKVRNEQIAPDKLDLDLIKISKHYLNSNKLLGKTTSINAPISFNVPDLVADNLDDHFKKIALHANKKYIKYTEEFLEFDLYENEFDKRIEHPKEWVFKSGWFAYPHDGSAPYQVEYPDDDALVFDSEVMYKIDSHAVMATALSSKAWYGWCSPFLTGESDSIKHLIPLNTINKPKLVIGHNVGYDRARIKEEYDLTATNAFFLDTLSLHSAVNGLCSKQRPKWMKYDKLRTESSVEEPDEVNKAVEDDPWVDTSSINGLAYVADFYCGIEVDKSDRDYFSEVDPNIIRENYQQLMRYCANDVEVTFKVFKKVLPIFFEKCPHPVSFASQRLMSSGILPTNNTWFDYVDTAENLFMQQKRTIDDIFNKLANDLLEKFKQDPNFVLNDPWFSQLDWTVLEPRLNKDGQPVKRQRYLLGYPEWYRKIYNNSEKKLELTTRTRIIPILLKLTWEGNPVVWSDTHGWCFRAETEKFNELVAKNYVYVRNFELTKKKLTKEEQKEIKLMEKEEIAKENADEFFHKNGDKKDTKFKPRQPESKYSYFKVPHSQGADSRTTLLLAKDFVSHLEKGVLDSPSPFAKQALEMNASCSYWISSRERIKKQFVVTKSPDLSLIIPQIIPMGTITRRAVEKTWLTASNAKKTRIGSELKSKIIAPPGYSLIGADVDSEELWIASLVGDSMFKLHGGTAIGWMTLEGNKNEKTDLHSRTADILNISRNDAKVFNYGRIYGAGVKFAAKLLKKFNPNLTEDNCNELAIKLYKSTKGERVNLKLSKDQYKKLWFGGSESILFNKLETIAEDSSPKTPVLGAGITNALLKENLNVNSFLPSRINWAIQSSGVDYLHLLIISMNYLIEKYCIQARFCISVHDEIRFLVKDEDKYRAAMALQISNLWTRGLFCDKLGISDVPQSCAFFSAVDIDHVLRKEVDMTCITPSNPIAIPPGESLDIHQLLSKPEALFIKEKDISFDEIEQEFRKAKEIEKQNTPDFTRFQPGMFDMTNENWRKVYLWMQIMKDPKQVYALLNYYKSHCCRDDKDFDLEDFLRKNGRLFRQ